MKALIALGSNLGDRAGYLARGLENLSTLGALTASPLILETLDESGQGPSYLNTIAYLVTAESNPCHLRKTFAF